MKIITGIAQGSVDWILLRSGKVTASGLKNILTPNFAVRTGEMPHTYMMGVLAEVWIGGPLPQVQGVWDMEQGAILESQARNFFTMTTGLEAQEAAFIQSDDDRFGASPDGIINGCEGLELKCPLTVTHLKYLDRGELPEEYACQVYGSLYASGFNKWHFVSYRSGFPMFHLVVERDEKIMASIKAGLDKFFANFDNAMRKLIKLNGGEPKRSPLVKPFIAPKLEPSFDVLP